MHDHTINLPQIAYESFELYIFKMFYCSRANLIRYPVSDMFIGSILNVQKC